MKQLFFLLVILVISAFATMAQVGVNRGGAIFYIDSTGHHGLISGPVNLASNTTWGCECTGIGTSPAIWHQYFADGNHYTNGKYNTHYVVAVRAF